MKIVRILREMCCEFGGGWNWLRFLSSHIIVKFTDLKF
jgi:hypothetical protein